MKRLDSSDGCAGYFIETDAVFKTVCPKCGKTWFSVSGFILFCPDCDASMQGMPVEIIGSNNDVIDVTALVSKKESEDEGNV